MGQNAESRNKPSHFCQLFFDKGALTLQWIIEFQLLMLEQLNIYMQKKAVGFISHTPTKHKNKLKRDVDLNARAKSINLLEENTVTLDEANHLRCDIKNKGNNSKNK